MSKPDTRWLLLRMAYNHVVESAKLKWQNLKDKRKRK
jgi:hypothetical protein